MFACKELEGIIIIIIIIIINMFPRNTCNEPTWPLNVKVFACPETQSVDPEGLDPHP
jgi:hypothetical protein